MNTVNSTPPALPDVQYSDLAHKRILVTGSSQGIGRTICTTLCAQGADVVGIANEASTIEDAQNGSYQHHICDLADADVIESCMNNICQTALDGIVNVAGIDPTMPLAEANLQQWQRVIDLDLRAYHLVIHHGISALHKGTLKSI